MVKKQSFKLKVVNIILSSLCFIMFVIAIYLKDLSAAEQIEPTSFVNYMEKEGCKVTSQSKLEDGVQAHYVTYSNTCPYDVRYLIVNDSSKRETLYKEMESVVKDNASINPKENVDYHSINYDEVSTMGENYKSVMKYKDSILFIDVSLNLKDKAILFKQDFGYYIEHKSYIYRTFLTSCIVLLLAILQVNGKLIGSSKVKVGMAEIFTKNS